MKHKAAGNHVFAFVLFEVNSSVFISLLALSDTHKVEVVIQCLLDALLAGKLKVIPWWESSPFCSVLLVLRDSLCLSPAAAPDKLTPPFRRSPLRAPCLLLWLEILGVRTWPCQRDDFENPIISSAFITPSIRCCSRGKLEKGGQQLEIWSF